MSIEQITREALTLPDDLKLKLVDELLASLELETQDVEQERWVAEVQRRRNAILSGEVQPIEGDATLARVRSILV